MRRLRAYLSLAVGATDEITSMKVELEWDPTFRERVICLSAYAGIQQFELSHAIPRNTTALPMHAIFIKHFKPKTVCDEEHALTVKIP